MSSGGKGRGFVSSCGASKPVRVSGQHIAAHSSSVVVRQHGPHSHALLPRPTLPPDSMRAYALQPGDAGASQHGGDCDSDLEEGEVREEIDGTHALPRRLEHRERCRDRSRERPRERSPRAREDVRSRLVRQGAGVARGAAWVWRGSHALLRLSSMPPADRSLHACRVRPAAWPCSLESPRRQARPRLRYRLNARA
jgi:hypothetical protein